VLPELALRKRRNTDFPIQQKLTRGDKRISEKIKKRWIVSSMVKRGGTTFGGEFWEGLAINKKKK